jgi:hypothetical protein
MGGMKRQAAKAEPPQVPWSATATTTGLKDPGGVAVARVRIPPTRLMSSGQSAGHYVPRSAAARVLSLLAQ